MNGQQLKDRRIKLESIRRHFAYLLGVTADKLYRFETGKTKLPPDIKLRVENIEKKFNKSKRNCQ